MVLVHGTLYNSGINTSNYRKTFLPHNVDHSIARE